VELTNVFTRERTEGYGCEVGGGYDVVKAVEEGRIVYG